MGTPKYNDTGDASVSFLCRALSYTKIMVGWAGAP
ncbi:TPA: hypothetical protein RKT71_002414 [Citrobacter freundii]|nr:hypothetical protein [Citrobacter freundii]